MHVQATSSIKVHRNPGMSLGQQQHYTACMIKKNLPLPDQYVRDLREATSERERTKTATTLTTNKRSNFLTNIREQRVYTAVDGYHDLYISLYIVQPRPFKAMIFTTKKNKQQHDIRQQNRSTSTATNRSEFHAPSPRGKKKNNKTPEGSNSGPLGLELTGSPT